MTSHSTDNIELLHAREWRGEPLAPEETAELSAFYQRLEREEAEYLAVAADKRMAEIRDREATISELQTVLREKRLRLARIRSLIGH